jgi:tetratricopeptide (TPR) repeat protein
MNDPTQRPAPEPASSGPSQQELEQLAEKYHDIWVAQVRGEADGAKTGKAVRPYRELSAEEKTRARRAAVAVWQAMPRTTVSDRSAETAAVLAELQMARKDRRKLLQLWRNRAKDLWLRSVDLYAAAAESLCLHGEAFAAIDVCQEGLRHFPQQVRLVQLKGWALAQSGATEASRKLLESLPEGEDASAETWSLRARTWKDLASAESDPVRKRELLAVACHHYERGYEHSVSVGRPDYYPAINCATLQMRMGQPDKAHEWAERAALLAAREPRTFWAEATWGEAALLLGEIGKAQQHYRAFAEECGQRAAIASARRQAAEILGSKDRVREVLTECLPLPPVLLLASGTEAPPDVSGAVVLCPWTARDAETVTLLLEKEGVEVHLVLAFPLHHYGPELFSLSPGQRELWLKHAASIAVAHPHDSRLTAELAAFCALLQVGRARRLAETWSTDLSFAAPGEGGDGPLHAYQETMRSLYEQREQLPEHCVARSMVFLDVVGYGQLDESRVSFFQQTILPRIAEFLRASATPPLFVQAWGDALYLGFSGVREGGLAVLALRRFFTAIPWLENGFDKPLKLRTAIHSGPVLTLKDPFTGGLYFTGTVVSRAARIEPMADEDQIFSSDAFAAVAAALGVREFSLTFAGTYLLPKNAGEEPLFRLAAAERPLSGG